MTIALIDLWLLIVTLVRSCRLPQWDPKITTFPGLYIISSLLIGPFYLCNTITLRLTSLVASIVNVFLIYEIRRHVCQRVSWQYSEFFVWAPFFFVSTISMTSSFHLQVRPLKIAVETLILAILPPMYLFAHLYYTDIVSVTMTLAMLNYSIKQRHSEATIFGMISGVFLVFVEWSELRAKFPIVMCETLTYHKKSIFFLCLNSTSGALSVLMRQTNIVWVVHALGSTAIDKLVSQTLPFLKDRKRSASPYSFHVSRLHQTEKNTPNLFKTMQIVCNSGKTFTFHRTWWPYLVSIASDTIWCQNKYDCCRPICTATLP